MCLTSQNQGNEGNAGKAPSMWLMFATASCSFPSSSSSSMANGVTRHWSIEKQRFPRVKSGNSGLMMLPAVAAVLIGSCTLAGVCRADEPLPKGFDVGRYQQIWERNPFTLVTPAAAQAAPSVFSKLVLLSWLQAKDRDIVFVQDTDTNDVKKITKDGSDNPDGLRLISVTANKNPSLTEAKLSNGKEEGVVKFRLEQANVNQVTTANGQIPGQNPALPNVPLGTRGGFNPNAPRRPGGPGQAFIPPNQAPNNPGGPPTPGQIRHRRTLATPVPTQNPAQQNEAAESDNDS